MNPKPPTDLGNPGGALRRAVLDDHELTPSETRLLQACRTTDEVDRIAEATKGADMVVTGSMAQPRPSPLLDEAGKRREVLSRLLAQLKESS